MAGGVNDPVILPEDRSLEAGTSTDFEGQSDLFDPDLVEKGNALGRFIGDGSGQAGGASTEAEASEERARAQARALKARLNAHGVRCSIEL